MAAFCRERELRASHFFWWKKRLRASPATKFVEVKLSAVGAELAGTAGASRAELLGRPAADRSPGGDGRVEVVLRNGRSLRVGWGFDAELVRALVALVEGAA